MFSNKGNTAPGLLKFQTPEDPIEQELKKKQWEAPNLIKMEYIDKKLREKEEAIKKAKNMQFEEAAAKLNAIEVYRMQIEMETYDAEVNECFLKDFRDFLQGKSAFNKNPKLVPWKEHPLVGRDIDAYLDAMLDKKLDFDKKIAKMTMFKMAPRNLQDAWMYYVFVVRGKRPPVDLFLKDWDAFYAIPKEFTPPQDGPYEEYKQTPSADLPNLKKPLPGGIVGPQEACKDSKVTFNNAGDIHEITNAAVQQTTIPTNRPIGHTHPANQNDDQNVPEATSLHPDAEPPVTIAINPAAPIEREPDDKMDVAAAPAVIKTTINNITQMPTEQFVEKFFKIQDERMDKLLNRFQLQNTQNAKTLYNNLGVVVTDVLQKTSALHNTQINTLIRNTEAVISRTIQKGLTDQSKSLDKLSKAVSETCGLTIESYKNNRRDPGPDGPAVTQALAQQAQEIGKLNNALNISQQNNNAMAQHLNALTQLVEQMKAVKPELTPVVEAVAANASAPILVQSENIAQATKLINKEIAPDVIQPDTGMSQQMITHRSRSRVLNRQVQMLTETEKITPKRKREEVTITDVTEESDFQPSVAQEATHQAVKRTATQLAIEAPPPALPTTQAQQEAFPQQLLEWHKNEAEPAIENQQLILYETAKKATEVQKSIHEINREMLKKIAIELKSWRAEYHMSQKFRSRNSASSHQISVANAEVHHKERMAKNPDRFDKARKAAVQTHEQRQEEINEIARNQAISEEKKIELMMHVSENAASGPMQPIDTQWTPFFVEEPDDKKQKKYEKAKKLKQQMKKSSKITVQPYKFDQPSESIGKRPAAVPEKFKDVVAPSAPTNESTAEIDEQIKAQTAILSHLAKTKGPGPEMTEAMEKVQELMERKKAMA